MSNVSIWGSAKSCINAALETVTVVAGATTELAHAGKAVAGATRIQAQSFENIVALEAKIEEHKKTKELEDLAKQAGIKF